MTSFTRLAEGQPAILAEPLSMTLAATCGSLALAMARMQASGMLEMMQQPGVIDRLIAE